MDLSADNDTPLPPEIKEALQKWLDEPIYEKIKRWKRETEEGIRDSEGKRLKPPKMIVFPPRQGDLPKEVLVAKANEILQQFAGRNPQIFFKFTCAHCGERNSFTEPNALYEEGDCEKCGQRTIVLFGGMTLKFDVK